MTDRNSLRKLHVWEFSYSRMFHACWKKRKKKENTKNRIYSYIKCIFVMHSGICFKNAYVYRLVI